MSDLFNQDVLARAVHNSLEEAYAALPPGKSHAVLLDASTDHGVRAMFVQRVGGGWEVAAQGEWSGRGHLAGKVVALKAW
jgi:hypothetical protein